MDWLNTNASAIQAVSAVISVIVTIVLVVITRTYVEETKKYRVEAEKTRQIGEDTLAQLKAEHDLTHKPVVMVQRWEDKQVDIANLGRGAALNINVRLSYRTNDGTYVCLLGRHHGLAPEQIAEITMNRDPNPPDTSAIKDLYKGNYVARVEVVAQNIVTGEMVQYLDAGLGVDMSRRNQRILKNS